MNDNKENVLSRREFAQRAALLSASLVPAGLILAEGEAPATASQLPGDMPKLSPEGQAETDARVQQIFSQYGSRFDGEQKAQIRTLCIYLQPMLERLRAFHLENGDAPGLYLKPLLEREKRPQPTSASNPASAAAKKP